MRGGRGGQEDGRYAVSGALEKGGGREGGIRYTMYHCFA